MSNKDAEAKKRILQTAIDLIKQAEDPGAVTVRQIAEAANVGIGLINYHFQSKDKLLNEAATVILMGAANMHASKSASSQENPLERLRTMLKDLSDILMHFESLNRLSVSYTLLNGNYDVQLLFITPLLRDIYSERKSETELRLIASAIIVPMQFAFLRPMEHRLFTGCDIYDKTQRDRYIDLVLANLVEP